MAAKGATPDAGLFAQLRECAERYRFLEKELEDPALHATPGRLAAVVREMGALREKAASYDRYEALTHQLASAEELLAGEEDAELRALAQDEAEEARTGLAALSDEVLKQIADDDPNRGRDVILEVRAGAGGDEATLFAADLVRIYTRFAETRDLKVEVLSSHPTDVGGYKEIVLGISGAAAWDCFRYEFGGHRVQRVPATESQGRIHTSAVTVAVLAEAEEVELEVRDEDLRIDTYRASGPGGQNVNKTSSAIRITHLPTGTVVQCQDESSQHKNKARALRMLRARLRDAQEQALKAERDSTRRAMIGSGDRSERIRTYNFPQNRVTDHRIKSNYSLDAVSLGRLDEVVEDLRQHDLQAKVAALSEGAS